MVSEITKKLVNYLFTSGTRREYERFVLAERDQLKGYPGWGKLPLADKIDEAITEAVANERERCAVIAEKQAGKNRTLGDTKAIAAAIRKQEATNCLNKP